MKCTADSVMAPIKCVLNVHYLHYKNAIQYEYDYVRPLTKWQEIPLVTKEH